MVKSTLISLFIIIILALIPQFQQVIMVYDFLCIKQLSYETSWTIGPLAVWTLSIRIRIAGGPSTIEGTKIVG